eukprot:TRINITY_DN795_c0_g2_i1.p1 TRINITY_DN795_c0_g2~~TRINITY_DN795_c0_g2_i1.p1  ORF type:complete len:127 (-),score=4.67 TRINITY_DN795_c0_g2_i1:8-388(-)
MPSHIMALACLWYLMGNWEASFHSSLPPVLLVNMLQNMCCSMCCSLLSVAFWETTSTFVNVSFDSDFLTPCILQHVCLCCFTSVVAWSYLHFLPCDLFLLHFDTCLSSCGVNPAHVNYASNKVQKL